LRKRYILHTGARAIDPDGNAYMMAVGPQDFDPESILDYRTEKVVEGQVQYVFKTKRDFDIACDNLRAKGARI